MRVAALDLDAKIPGQAIADRRISRDADAEVELHRHVRESRGREAGGGLRSERAAGLRRGRERAHGDDAELDANTGFFRSAAARIRDRDGDRAGLAHDLIAADTAAY